MSNSRITTWTAAEKYFSVGGLLVQFRDDEGSQDTVMKNIFCITISSACLRSTFVLSVTVGITVDV